MKKPFAFVALASALGIACGGTSTTSTSDASPADAGGGDGSPTDGGALTWYLTCGYPVCRAGMLTDGGDAGEVDAGGAADAPSCPPVGSPCGAKGETCGTPSDANCGVIQQCDDHVVAVMCAASSRKYKDDIQYVDDAELARLHDAAVHMKLATYRYKGSVADPDPTHLGFIIEDNPGSPAIDRLHDRVDMYGYVTMVVASMQVQEKEIAALRRDLEAARHDAAMCRKPSK